MSTEARHSLVETLKQPDSFDDWLLGTQYSQKYMAKLKLKTNSRPVLSSTRGKLTNTHAAKIKAVHRAQSPGSSERKITENENDIQSSKISDNRLQGDVIPKKIDIKPRIKSGNNTRKKNDNLFKNCEITMNGHLEDSIENVTTRDLLCGSYYRMKGSYPGVFPALLTPYQRPFWSYKELSEEKDEISKSSKFPQQSMHLPNTTSSLPQQFDILDIPQDQRPIIAKRHNPSGPPSFAPTPTSIRWLRTMRQ